jgi:TIR domain
MPPPPPITTDPPRRKRRAKGRASAQKRSAPPVREHSEVDKSVAHNTPPPVQTEVFLGAATPRVVVPGSEFVARFAAYVEKFRQQVSTIFAKEAPRSESLLDLASCRWQVGTKVSVRLSARDLTVKTEPQSFTWNGEYETLRFDVEVPPDCRATQAVLKFDIMIDGMIIATLRPEIEISKALAAGQAAAIETTEVRSPRSAFASYATTDRRNVLGRVRSLQIHTGIDVFFDCLSIRPGEQWKSEIVKQIRDREIFWLFWSRRARKSNWVEWEWRQALDAKTLRGIQPHPLEPSDLAPPPPELEDLQFGSAYECYLVTLQESWFKYKLHRIKETVGRLFGS